MSLDELPEPVAWQWLDTAHFRRQVPAHANLTDWNPLHTADQLHAAIAAEREKYDALFFAFNDACADGARARAELDTLREQLAEAVRDAERLRSTLTQIRADAAAQGVLFEWLGAIDAALAAKGDGA